MSVFGPYQPKLNLRDEPFTAKKPVHFKVKAFEVTPQFDNEVIKLNCEVLTEENRGQEYVMSIPINIHNDHAEKRRYSWLKCFYDEKELLSDDFSDTKIINMGFSAVPDYFTSKNGTRCTSWDYFRSIKTPETPEATTNEDIQF